MPRASTVGTHRRLHVSVLREDLSDAETHGPASCRSSYYGGQGEVERTQLSPVGHSAYHPASLCSREESTGIPGRGALPQTRSSGQDAGSVGAALFSYQCWSDTGRCPCPLAEDTGHSPLRFPWQVERLEPSRQPAAPAACHRQRSRSIDSEPEPDHPGPRRWLARVGR